MLKEIKIELTNKCARNCKHCSSNATRTDETLNKYKHLINLGLNKIVYSLADSLSDEKDISIYNNEDIIRYMYEHQDEEFKRLNLNFKRIGNRPLQLIDCQNIFCELDKYCRQAIPDLRSNRTKIKKHYIPKKDKIEYIYPPKWELNT